MDLSAPTRVVFIISLILALLSLLPVLGVKIGVLGLYSYWLLFAGFLLLVAGNLFRDL